MCSLVVRALQVSGCQVSNLQEAFERLRGPINSPVEILVQVNRSDCLSDSDSAVQ